MDIFIDGSCIGNPGPGGYGVVIADGQNQREISARYPDTTNNRMELMAAIVALELLPRGSVARIYTDSQYVQRGMTEWVNGWIAKGWRTADKKPVKNEDLWRRLLAVAAQHEVEWAWVRGHNGHAGNERAHALAEAAARRRA